MKWSKAYATGVEHLDRQHQMLFQMSEDFGAGLAEGRGQRVYGQMLESLELYASGHFGIEDQCMVECHCPAAEANSQAHARFLEALAEFRERYAAAGFDRADAHRLVAFVDQWLADHIGRIDVQLRPYVAAPR